VVTGGKTPDVGSERRTFADVMTESKLRQKEVGNVYLCLVREEEREVVDLL